MYKIAHRGYSDLHKDNTMPSFLAAIDNSFDIIELDIQLTKDNIIIIFHDTFINDKLIENMNYKEIVAIDRDVITLNELFEKINDYNINIYLDVKGSDFICVFLHKILMQLNDFQKILIGSFNTMILTRMYQLNNKYSLGLITENVLDNVMLNYYVGEYNLAFVCFHWTALNHSSINFLKSKNVLVFTYTCKNHIFKTFIDKYFVDGIVSNCKL